MPGLTRWQTCPRSIERVFAKKLLPLVRVAQTLAQKYDVVVTNPPYMGSSGMGTKLAEYVKKNYPDTRSDMSTVFMEKGLKICKENGFMAMINIPVWMFIASYEKLRNILITGNSIINMVHPGRGIFGSDFGTTTFVITKCYVENYVGQYRRLFDKQGDVEPVEIREQAFFNGRQRFESNQMNFVKIPGCPIAYWVSQNVISDFYKNESVGTGYGVAKKGLSTGANDDYLRFWNEVDINECAFNLTSYKEPYKWIPINKGGSFRKWYGNNEYVILWYDNGAKIRSYKGAVIRNPDYYFKESITWTMLSASCFGVRYSPAGKIFEGAGPSLFVNDENKLYILALLCSKIGDYFVRILNPTININIGDINNIPVIIGKKNIVETIAKRCIDISKKDWDSFETSWDFTRHPFIKAITKYPNMMDIGNIYLAECYDIWAGECEERFEKLKANEEELNRIFIDIYGLQDELTPEVEDKDVTVRKADLGRDVRSFISYAVGCMFGRYSPTFDGLAYAGGTWDDGKYNIYKPDADGIIPICDDEYFEDDMVGRFVEFVRVVYGDRSLEDNLRFVANALGGKGQPKEVIRNYFLNDFYTDHCKIYQKRPIYWLFDSGKKNGFKCLIYLHRYQPDTIARIRTDYVHEQQARYRTAIEGLEKQVAAATSTSERVKLTKQLNKVQAQDAELHQYEEKVHALVDQMIKIDLDDGVKHNYEIFKDVLAKIK